jgi:hypothetical protein
MQAELDEVQTIDDWVIAALKTSWIFMKPMLDFSSVGLWILYGVANTGLCDLVVIPPTLAFPSRKSNGVHHFAHLFCYQYRSIFILTLNIQLLIFMGNVI